jgi:hypothetical protein
LEKWGKKIKAFKELIIYRIIRQTVKSLKKRRMVSKLNIENTFPLYAPSSSGSYKQLSDLTIESINQIFPILDKFISDLHREMPVVSIKSFCNEMNLRNALEFKQFADREGSDKAINHQYHFIYGEILSKRILDLNILEIGIGSNNLDTVSNMGKNGKPGASLRAFRDFCPNSKVFGADVDERILFEEPRLSTFKLDQTKAESFVEFKNRLPLRFDLVIDDGLHSPLANLMTLQFGISVVKKFGWVVIEDIPKTALSLWKLVSFLIPSTFNTYLIQDNEDFVFAIKRMV